MNLSRSNLAATPEDLDLAPPWTAEFWLFRASAVEEVCLLAKEAMLWSARRVEAEVDFVQHTTAYDRTKQRMNEIKKREVLGQSTPEEDDEMQELIFSMKTTATLKAQSESRVRVNE